MRLPPFPTDDTTLGMLEAAMDPWSHGEPEAVKSSLWPLLEVMSQLGGSDTRAVAQQLEDNMFVMRDPHYTEHCVITALIGEIRRLRAAPAPGRTVIRRGGPAVPALTDQIRQAIKDLLAAQRVTQAQLAARVGVTAKHMSQMLRGRASISAQLADQMLTALGRRPMLRVVTLRRNDP